MWDEFKKFAFKGNVVDLAVAVVIGAAFGAIVKSIVDNLIMPPIGLLTGGVDFSELHVVLKRPPGGAADASVEELTKAGGVAIRYGLVVNALLSFVLVAIAVFVLVKVVNRAIPKKVEAATTRDCPQCLLSIPLKATRCGHCAQPVA
jgi:large conductance mechanosensitive channel